MKRWLYTLLVLIPVVLQAQEASREALLNKLFAPGPLIEGHKDLEATDCMKCHDAGKGLPSQKCLECHKEILPFVNEKRGLHGRTDKKCQDCHSDHQGRQHDTTILNEAKFNHDITGLSLTGKHAQLKCTDCHKQKRSQKPIRPDGVRYIGQISSCISCHRKDDIHQFTDKWARKDCDACHNSQAWKTVTKFDHNRDTRFQLEEKHAQLKCQDCHSPQKPTTPKSPARYHWKQLSSSKCLSCHESPHRQNLSAKYQNGNCTTCHNQTSWKTTSFPHQNTGYPLRGKHAQLRCTDCHKQNAGRPKAAQLNYKGLSQACLTCHKDQHLFGAYKSPRIKNPNNCLSCHSESDWKKTHDFNHSTNTRFEIDGKHSALSCADCHLPEKKKAGLLMPLHRANKPGRYLWHNLTSASCNACHQNPHLGSPSKAFTNKKCSTCHITEGWHLQPNDKKGTFDHNQTRFQLSGQHQNLKCSSCHNQNGKQVFKFPSFESGFCLDCHRNPHLDQFHTAFSAKNCTECHTTTRFSDLKSFDHERTAFSLKGRHKDLKCADCHKPLNRSTYGQKEVVWHRFLFPDLEKKSCTTCHSDFHAGQLGISCQNCHNEKKWSPTNFNHNKGTRFALSGKHVKTKCSDCHKPHETKRVQFGPDQKAYRLTLYRPLSTDCVDCHKRDDTHKGQFGNRCQSCHIDKGWSIVKDFHRNFTLHASHFTLSCVECHREDRKLSGLSESCSVCHQKDDVHNGSLPNCSECHRQTFWEHSKFRHSMTAFPLRGSHRALDCFSCHNNGVYQGTYSSCTDCHRNNVDNSTFNHAPILGVQECNKCHNQFTFDLGL